MPRDLARFYLALTAPEFQRTNFTEADLRWWGRPAARPWNRLATALDKLAVSDGVVLKVTEAGRPGLGWSADRLRRHYLTSGSARPRSPTRSSPSWAGWRVTGSTRTPQTDVLAQVRRLLAYAAPLLIDVTDTLVGAEVRPPIDDGSADKVTMFRLPLLPDVFDRLLPSTGAA